MIVLVSCSLYLRVRMKWITTVYSDTYMTWQTRTYKLPSDPWRPARVPIGCCEHGQWPRFSVVLSRSFCWESPDARESRCDHCSVDVIDVRPSRLRKADWICSIFAAKMLSMPSSKIRLSWMLERESECSKTNSTSLKRRGSVNWYDGPPLRWEGCVRVVQVGLEIGKGDTTGLSTPTSLLKNDAKWLANYKNAPERSMFRICMYAQGVIYRPSPFQFQVWEISGSLFWVL